jgi:hypothetical protein
MSYDKILTIEKERILFLIYPNVFVAITCIGDKCYPSMFAVSPRDEDEDNFNDDDDYYNEEDEDKNNPFDREPTDKDIVDEDLPLSIPEEDLIDDDEEIPYN